MVKNDITIMKLNQSMYYMVQINYATLFNEYINVKGN